MADEVIDATPKKRRSGRLVARGKDGLFDVVGAELVEAIIKGETGVRRARKPGWLAKQLGLRFPKPVKRWRQKKGRPELAQAIALAALYPWCPVTVWLTAEERQMVQAAHTMGQIIAAEPPPNPKANRRKDKVDPRQVTLEQMIAMKTPPPKPAAPAQDPIPPAVDEPDLGDWDPDPTGLGGVQEAST